MIDYKYLKDNNLYESHLRFMRAINEGYGYAPIEEADDDKDDQQGGGMPPMDEPQGGDPMGGPQGQDSQGGGMPPMGGPQGDGPMLGGDAPMGAEPQGGGMPPMDGPQGDGPIPDGGPMGEDPMGGDPMGMSNEEPEEDEEVIDVDDITNAQEKTNDKVNSVGRDLGKVDNRIEKLINAIDKLETMFDKNNQDIVDLRKEFEKRNPTQTEKLNLRSLDSYPFNVRPTDYWAEKAKNSNYSAYADNQEPTTNEYVITNSDVDDFNDREIADSFFIDDDLNQDIKKIFGLS